MALGTIIREERKKRQLTQKELAERTGVSQSLIARFEGGTEVPAHKYLKKISQVLGIDISLLTSALTDKNKESPVFQPDDEIDEAEMTKLFRDSRSLPTEDRWVLRGFLRTLMKVRKYHQVISVTQHDK